MKDIAQALKGNGQVIKNIMKSNGQASEKQWKAVENRSKSIEEPFET